MVPYGIELRERVMRAWDSGELQADVAERFEVSLRWIQQLARLRRETGCLAPKRATGGRPAQVRGDVEDRLRAACAADPDATLDELRVATGIEGSVMIVFRALERMQITRKKSRSSQPSS